MAERTNMTQTFRNISKKYGTEDFIVTLEDYRESNPNAIFEIRGGTICELDKYSHFTAVVAIADDGDDDGADINPSSSVGLWVRFTLNAVGCAMFAPHMAERPIVSLSDLKDFDGAELTFFGFKVYTLDLTDTLVCIGEME